MGAVTATVPRSLDGVAADLDGRTTPADPEIVAGTRVTRLRYRVRH